eukprot:1151279-Pelagomonas_calceolata.AAC.3
MSATKLEHPSRTTQGITADSPIHPAHAPQLCHSPAHQANGMHVLHSSDTGGAVVVVERSQCRAVRPDMESMGGSRDCKWELGCGA